MALALFDMDGTLIAGNATADYIHSRWQRGLLRTTDALRAFVIYGRYRLGAVDMVTLLHEAAKEVAGQPEQALVDECRTIYEERVRARICPAMRQIVEDHRQRGDTLAIVTASTPYIARHLAAELGIAHLLATELEVVDGLFTGKLAGDPCYGRFKIDAVERLLHANAQTLQQAWFYTDSDTDAPLLLRVGHPVAVRPDPRLRWRAWRNGWPLGPAEK